MWIYWVLEYLYIILKIHCMDISQLITIPIKQTNNFTFWLQIQWDMTLRWVIKCSIALLRFVVLNLDFFLPSESLQIEFFVFLYCKRSCLFPSFLSGSHLQNNFQGAYSHRTVCKCRICWVKKQFGFMFSSPIISHNFKDTDKYPMIWIFQYQSNTLLVWYISCIPTLKTCTVQDLIGILGYGCLHACALICNKSEMKCVTLLCVKNIHKTQNKNEDIIYYTKYPNILNKCALGINGPHVNVSCLLVKESEPSDESRGQPQHSTSQPSEPWMNIRRQYF